MTTRAKILLAILAFMVQGILYAGLGARSFETGRYSVFFDCAKSGLAINGDKVLLCAATKMGPDISMAPDATPPKSHPRLPGGTVNL